MVDGRFVRAICLSIVALACGTHPAEIPQPDATSSALPASDKSKSAVSEIDISKIGRIAPKGRVQDKDYNDIEVVDQLIAKGKDSIPFLISKLDDGTTIHHHVIDYWPGDMTVGDVAFVILSDFTTDSTWARATIPGADRDTILGKADPNAPGVERVARFVDKYGRKPIRQKWEEIWLKYKDQIVWDDQQRCFKAK
ncbi:MAG: hypothetical protein ND895_15485 [Pyrinomonadaceae bacterium]|nr:hypothetical protein [Pyrinomonadaceae bacterium]